jgi:rod shape determining protein RodA
MKRETGFFRQLDWWTIAIYMVLVLIGWISIFASVYDPEHNRIIDTTQRYGMQMIWIFGAWFLAIAVLLIPSRTYLLFSGVFYILGILILLAVLVLGVERNGSQSWLVFGPVHFQPAEMAKVFVALALAGLMSRPQFRLRSLKAHWKSQPSFLFRQCLS